VLHTGHQLVQERAAKISDGEDRRSYLENVEEHTEIASEYALVEEHDRRAVLGGSRTKDE